MPTTNEFINSLSDSNLLSEDLLARIRKRVGDSGGKFDPRSIAKYLIERNHLTLWQANQLLAGRRAFYLGRYKLLDRIGKGGMGVVFKAQHAVMDRVVAIKVMSRSLLDNPQAVARFNREVRAAAALNHPNIISAYDADCVGNTHFLVMEYVDGKDLNAWLKARGAFPVRAAVDCALQTANGLAYAHRQGMVHRDIKPVNLLLQWNSESNRPVVKVLDLGLARFVSETNEEGGLTRMGQTIGTPDYIAPEAAQSFRDADIRADIFSLGCTLFKLLTGRLPFAGENTMEKLVARTTHDAPLLRTVRSECPAALEAVVAKMLARSPGDRYQDPAELIKALESVAAELGDAASDLQFFRDPLEEKGALSTGDIQADADTSLADFFRDFSVSPMRDEKPAEPRSESGDDGLELLPLDGDAPQPATKGSSPPDKKSTRKEPGSKDKKAKAKQPPRLVDPLPEDEAEPAAAGTATSLLDEVGDPARKRGGSSASEARERAFREAATGVSMNARRGRWDSPLMLVGGGSLLLLVIVGAALYYANNRRTGDELLKAATDSYKNGAYAQAAREYEKFLEEFPEHKEASSACVFHGLSRMRHAVNQGGDWSAALATTRQSIADISGESRFGEARSELASILPTLAEGIAQAASRTKDPQLVEDGHESLTLSEKYVPSEIRQGQRIQSVVRSLELTSREIARSSALEQTVSDMQEAAADGRTAEGYELRKELLKTYPDLATHESLNEAVLAVAAAEQGAVQVDRTQQAAQTGDVEPAAEGTVSLAAQQGKAAPGVSGQILFAHLGTSALAVDASEGQLLWRRNIGAGENVSPVPINNQAGADGLFFDAARHELWRVDAASGDVRWRQSTGDALAGNPVVTGNTVWLSTQTGKLLSIDAEDGSTRLTIQLPQPVTSSPVLAARAKKVYQVGGHSSLFVLSSETGECEQVLYLGHAAGTVVTPPLAVNRYLFIAENHLLDNARLRVLLADEAGSDLQQRVTVPLDGHVDSPLQMLDRSLYVVTDLGAVYAFEVNAPGEREPLTRQAQAPATSPRHQSRLFVARSARLWVASDELLRYDIQIAQGRLFPAGQRFQGDIFERPLTAIGNVLFTARRKQGTAAVTLAALNLQNGDVFWESELATPVAAVLPASNERAYAVTSDGALYRVSADANSPRSVVAPVSRPEGQRLQPDDVRLAHLNADRLLVTSGGDAPAALLIDFSTDEPSAEWLPSDGWATAPSVLAGNVVAAMQAGLVGTVKAPQNSKPIQPWAPQRGIEKQSPWRDLAAYGEDHLLLAGGAAQLFLLALDDRPIERITSPSQAALEQTAGNRLAVAGDSAYLVVDSRQLMRVSLPNLKPDEPFALSAPAVWGPRAVGQYAYVATADGALHCFDGKSAPAWSASVAAGSRMAGMTADEHLLVATVDGKLVALDIESGQELATTETGERFSADPIVVGNHVLVGTRDGNVLRLAMPAP